MNGVDEPAVQVIGQLDDSCGDLIKVNLLLTTITLQNEHLGCGRGRKSNYEGKRRRKNGWLVGKNKNKKKYEEVKRESRKWTSGEGKESWWSYCEVVVWCGGYKVGQRTR